MRTFASAITALTLLLPTLCLAESVKVWDFQSGDAPREMRKTGDLNIVATSEGIRIQAAEPGSMTVDISGYDPFDVVTITYSSPTELNPGLVWNAKGQPEESLLIAPIVLSASENMTTVNFDLNRYNEWSGETARFGIAFQPETDIRIAKIEFKGYGFADKITEGWKSFWTFDRMRPSSINFLWGPQIAFTPTARKQMFNEVLPVAHSGNWVFYVVMLVAVVFLLARYSLFGIRNSKKSPITNNQLRITKTVTAFICIIASLWILYDVRMGSEFLSYIKRDYDTYWSKEPGKRTFRERRFFFDFAFQVAPVVKDQEHYAFLSHERWPFLGLMRYYTYPSVPQVSSEGVRTWAVYRRPDITVNVHGQLTENGKLLSTSGRMIHEFEEGTFLFQTNPPPEVR